MDFVKIHLKIEKIKRIIVKTVEVQIRVQFPGGLRKKWLTTQLVHSYLSPS